MTVYQAIQNVMRDIGAAGIGKTRRNAQQNYQFRGIDDVYNDLNPIMVEHGLLMLPRVQSTEQTERQTQKGGLLIYTKLVVDFDFVSAVDGSKHTITTVGEAMDSADKSSNKAMSAAYKYAAIMAFCIPTEGDNDADATTHEVAPVVLSKADARDVYKSLSDTIKKHEGTAQELASWWKSADVETRRQSLPEDWRRELHTEMTDKHNELKKKVGHEQLD